jgi:4-amino-4-deoxy-L-arabinose transferase-like glycosyltransferase
MEKEGTAKLFPKTWMTATLVIALFIGALAIRLFDLTDLPNDFYMVRQYRSLLIARGMYYATLPSVPQWQRDFAISQGKGEGLIEPPIMEMLTALTYRVTGEQIWVGRVYASLFWLTGGLALWLLAKELKMREGAFIAVAYFLFVGFGMNASWAFMPDSLMTALIAWSMWGLQRWENRRTWKAAMLAGILTGLAILVKSVAVFPLLGAALGLVINRRSIKAIFTDKQTWLVAGITALPTIIYYICRSLS